MRVCEVLLWRHNGQDSVSNHQPHHCLLNRLFGRRSKKHQSSASLAFVRGIHRGPVNSPHKWPVTRKMFSFDDVIMRKALIAGMSSQVKYFIDRFKATGPYKHNNTNNCNKNVCERMNALMASNGKFDDTHRKSSWGSSEVPFQHKQNDWIHSVSHTKLW